MSAKPARINDTVEYREGDGPNIEIPRGPVEIEETELEAIISWTEGDARGSAAMPLDDYRRYLESRAITLDA